MNVRQFKYKINAMAVKYPHILIYIERNAIIKSSKNIINHTHLK